MGNPRALYYAIALTLSLFLTSCGRRTWTEDEIRDIAADAAEPDYPPDHSSEIEELTGKVTDLEAETANLQAQIDALAAAHDSLSETVNFNADVANRNAGIR